MRFMMIVRADKTTEAGVMPTDDTLITAMADYHEALQKAGVLLDGNGLKPSAKGWRIAYDGDRRTITDGPFAEAKELIAGYTVMQVKSREEAMEWSRRFPNPSVDNTKAVLEVRELYELEDLGSGEATERLREMGIGTEK